MSEDKNIKADAQRRSLLQSFWDDRYFISIALIVAFILRSFFYQPFNIPSGSMKPTLLIGDFIFTSKFAYGYSRHSMPFSPPLWQGRLWEDKPQRGDVVVFKLPSDGRTDYIKRLIGLPGDEIELRNGVVYLNGKALPRERISDFVEPQASGQFETIIRYKETLPNGVSYEVLDSDPASGADNTPLYIVPDGHYFLMGDNRDNSADSRFLSHVGYVPYENLVGQADIVFFSFDNRYRWWQFWYWPIAIRYGKLLEEVK